MSVIETGRADIRWPDKWVCIHWETRSVARIKPYLIATLDAAEAMLRDVLAACETPAFRARRPRRAPRWRDMQAIDWHSDPLAFDLDRAVRETGSMFGGIAIAAGSLGAKGRDIYNFAVDARMMSGDGGVGSTERAFHCCRVGLACIGRLRYKVEGLSRP